MGPWAELDGHRWAWSERAARWLYRETFGEPDHAITAEIANVMVVGDTQVGKTTLLTRLLGVTEPAVVDELDDVLRGGREGGDSATPVPIRYRWSTRDEDWLLVSDRFDHARWVDDAQLRAHLEQLRAPDGALRWRPTDRPLEIGLPRRMADPAARRPRLRVLDLPGLAARNRQEQPTARAMVARFAPLMNLIVFVQLGDAMAEAFTETAITDNPFLAGWTSSPVAFRVVLTRAFTQATVRAQLLELASSPDPDGHSAPALLAYVRERLADQLAKSLGPGVSAADLRAMVHPVELGTTLRDFAALQPGPGALIRDATAIALDELAGAIDAASSVQSHGLRTLDAAVRIADRVQRQVTDRAEVTTRHGRAVDRARAELTAAGAALTAAEATLRTEERWFAAARRAVEDLRTEPVRYRRPSKPPMRADLVRDTQEDERQALAEAVDATWTGWRGGVRLQPCPFPESVYVDRRDLRRRYDDAVECCGRCTERAPFSWFAESPDHCYTRMTAAGTAAADWIRDQLVDRAAEALRNAEPRVVRARAQYAAATRMRADANDLLTAAEAELDLAAQRQRREQDRADRHLRVVGDIRSVLERENRAQVTGLRARLAEAPETDRGWYAVAALRSLLDLRETLGDP